MAVEAYLDGSTHARLPEVRALRALVLSADASIGEHVRWNAPSLVVDGVDRVTMRLQPGDQLQLVLHRGAKVRSDSATFRFDDPSGLVVWRTPDRGVVTVVDALHLDEQHDALVDLVRRWVQA